MLSCRGKRGKILIEKCSGIGHRKLGDPGPRSRLRDKGKSNEASGCSYYKLG